MCGWVWGCMYALVNEKIIDMDLKVTLHRQYMYFRSMCISVCGWVSAYMRVCVWVRGCI